MKKRIYAPPECDIHFLSKVCVLTISSGDGNDPFDSDLGWE